MVICLVVALTLTTSPALALRVVDSLSVLVSIIGRPGFPATFLFPLGFLAYFRTPSIITTSKRSPVVQPWFSRILPSNHKRVFPRFDPSFRVACVNSSLEMLANAFPRPVLISTTNRLPCLMTFRPFIVAGVGVFFHKSYCCWWCFR